jgi:hypothetical protein
MAATLTIPTKTTADATLTIPATARRPGFFRRFAAVFAGLLANVVLASVVDGVLHATGVYPTVGKPMSQGLFVLAFSYRCLFGVAGAYLTARLAPDRPMRHAMVLGGIGIALSLVGAVVMRGQGPLWYPLALAAITLPACWLGVKLRGR